MAGFAVAYLLELPLHVEGGKDDRTSPPTSPDVPGGLEASPPWPEVVPGVRRGHALIWR